MPKHHHTETFLISDTANRRRHIAQRLGRVSLLLATSVSVLSVLFIFIYIARDAWPFFAKEGIKEFLTSTRWYPSRSGDAEFGAFAIIYGSAVITIGASILCIIIGIPAAVALSDVLSFNIRQIAKPVIEILAAIPSVVYGFFALVVFAPLLQNMGGPLLAGALWLVGIPLGMILCVLSFNSLAQLKMSRSYSAAVQLVVSILITTGTIIFMIWASFRLYHMEISSGTNALNGIIILGFMALPTVVSISEDALNAVGRELREGSYALGATRAETIVKVVIPAAKSGILAAVILGIMRAIGETMVVWMATGNASRIPKPWYNVLEPIRTLTATIAGDMGEADHVTGSSRYHVLFAMALFLLFFTFLGNIITESIIRRKGKTRIK
ncbi:MAG: PstC family ABC transporter permease [Pseudomonadota bacterium]